MIAFLSGVLCSKAASEVTVRVGGVGFRVFMPTSCIAQLPEIGQEVEIYTYLHVREDALLLYGFSSAEEKSLFERLIGVSGVGPKVALAALSFYSPVQITRSIAAQDVEGIAKIPGVGKKTAQRMILELKGSLDKELLSSAASGVLQADSSDDVARKGAAEALLSMGFTTAEVDVALKGAPEGVAEKELLQCALKKLGGR